MVRFFTYKTVLGKNARTNKRNKIKALVTPREYQDPNIYKSIFQSSICQRNSKDENIVLFYLNK